MQRTDDHQSQKHLTCTFPTRNASIFLSLLVTGRLRLRKRRRARDESATSRVSFDFSDISSHLLRAVSRSVDSEEDFLLVSLPHLPSSIMSLYISPTTVLPSCYFIRRLIPDALLHAAAIVEKKLQPEQETSAAPRLFLPRKIVSRNEIVASCRRALCVYTSDERSSRGVKISRYFMYLEKRLLRRKLLQETSRLWLIYVQ